MKFALFYFQLRLEQKAQGYKETETGFTLTLNNFKDENNRPIQVKIRNLDNWQNRAREIVADVIYRHMARNLRIIPQYHSVMVQAPDTLVRFSGFSGFRLSLYNELICYYQQRVNPERFDYMEPENIEKCLPVSFDELIEIADLRTSTKAEPSRLLANIDKCLGELRISLGYDLDTRLYDQQIEGIHTQRPIYETQLV